MFNKGLPKYTFNTRCDEDNELILGDEVTKVFLNTTASIEGINPKLGSLLEYISTGHPSDEYTKKIDDAVISSRKHKSWRAEYMKYFADRTDWIEEGKEIGFEQGLEQGIKQGIKQGTEQGKLKLFNTIASLYSEGQLSLEVAIRSSELTKEEFLERYEIYKENSSK